MSIEKADIKYDSKNNFIVMKALAEASIEAMKQSFDQILEMSEIENCKNVLIDATKTIKLPSISNIHSLGTFMSKQALKLIKMRIAFAINEERSSEWRFLDNVLVNRMVGIQFFKNFDDAKDWILNKE